VVGNRTSIKVYDREQCFQACVNGNAVIFALSKKVVRVIITIAKLAMYSDSMISF